MNKTSNDLKVEVFLENDEKGQNFVRVSLSDKQSPGCYLTPAQARALATELIQAVHKAEVRHKLQGNGANSWHVSNSVV